MASAVGGPSAGGRRRSLDAEICLVPFIDLLSMCICFLLMTAVWMEVSALPMRQILGTQAPSADQTALDVELRFRPDQNLEFRLLRGGQIVQTTLVEGADRSQRLARAGGLIGNLMNAVDPATANITARVVPSVSLSYGDMMAFLDLLRGYGISQLGVVPVKE